MPKSPFLLLLYCLLPNFLIAQATFSGQVLDANSKRAVVDASIQIMNSPLSCRTNQEGAFSIQVLRSGRYTLTIDKKGYEPQRIEVQIYFGCPATTILVTPKLLGSQIWESWTPTLLNPDHMLSDTVLEQQLGNQDLAEIFRQFPGAYASRQGGGWGDSRLHFHGFTQQEVTFTLNGIPLDDPENGEFYWSRWSVLRHLQPQFHFEPGTGQSLLANNAVGGELSMLSMGPSVTPQRSFTHLRGNDNFQSYRLLWQHGLGRGQWGLTAMVAHDRGDGYVDGTEFQAYSYFLSLEKRLNARHRINLTALGSSQWHHRRTIAGNLDQITLRTFVNPDAPEDFTDLGLRFNHDWGRRAGETFSARRNFYSQPLYSLNHVWQIKPQLRLTTMGYGYHGRGGETGLRGRIWNGFSSIGDSFTGFGEGIYDSLGQIRFADLVAYNQGELIEDFGDVKMVSSDGQYIVTRNGRIGSDRTGSGFIRRASINNTDHYGVVSMATYHWSKKLNLSAGVDYRQFRSQHFRRVEDLLGADAYLAQGNTNLPDNLITEATPASFGDLGTDARAGSANVLNYNYSGQIRTLAFVGRIEYLRKNWQLFGQINQGRNRLSRTDYFNYDPTDTPENDMEADGEFFESPTLEYAYHNYRFGGSLRWGRGHRLSAQYSQALRAPLFDELFEGNRNRINTEPSDQQARSWQVNYQFQKKNWLFQVQVYQQNWSGQVAQQALTNYTYVYQGDSLQVNALARLNDVRQVREGINMSFIFELNPSIQLNGRLGWGNWRYPENQIGEVTDLDNNRTAGKATFATADLPIGDAAQTTVALGLQWELHPRLFLRGDYFYFDRIHASWNIAQSVPEKVVELPAYGLLDLNLSYRILLGKSADLRLLFQMNNVLNEVYVAELASNIADDPLTPNTNEFYDNRGIFGFGRTWSGGVEIRF